MGRSKLIKTIFERSLIPLNSLLLFFLLFEPRIVLPAWLQVFGRMHPLALHFPIVLVMIYAGVMIFFPSGLRKERWFISAVDAVLLSAAFTASVTALMGFALSRNEGYDPDSLSVHKWTGVFIPFVLYFFYLFRKKFFTNILSARITSVAITVLVIVAGHHGATITHGENFILAPVTPVNVRVVPPFEDAFVYNDLVQPILENKCMTCHNNKKSKGELIMDTKELFVKGGKNGVPWDTAKADLGILISRLHMPLEDKEHMPPKGKPQLSDDELFIVHEWVKRGANFEQKFTDLLPSDTFYVIGRNKLPSSSEEKYDFAAAEEKTVSGLNNNNRLVSPIALGSPALAVTFYNRKLFKISDLKDLAPVSDKIVELNLPKLDIKDEDISILRQFRNLRRLNLNFTSITGKTLGELKSLPFLKMISLSGTGVDVASLKKLENFPKLKTVYLWSTPAASARLDDLHEKNKNIAYYAGFKGDTVTLQLTPPIMENEEVIISKPIHLNLKHFLKGTTIRYTIDGEDPDSIHSAVYTPDVIIDSNVTIKAKAFRQGWISSNVLEHHFYKKKFVADNVKLLTLPIPRYAANKGYTLNDNEQSDLNFASGKWLGYEKNNLEALMTFEKSITTTNLTLSVLDDMSSNIFIPLRVEVWGGENINHLKLLGSANPEMPREMRSRRILALQCNYSPATVKYIKLIVKPVNSVPGWHQRKGHTAMVFVDEVFVN